MNEEKPRALSPQPDAIRFAPRAAVVTRQPCWGARARSCGGGGRVRDRGQVTGAEVPRHGDCSGRSEGSGGFSWSTRLRGDGGGFG